MCATFRRRASNKSCGNSIEPSISPFCLTRTLRAAKTAILEDRRPTLPHIGETLAPEWRPAGRGSPAAGAGSGSFSAALALIAAPADGSNPPRAEWNKFGQINLVVPPLASSFVVSVIECLRPPLF
ncbi:hypothetical protein Zmor_022133 [Zophobas morio]|uniref:Uncharacterized protein n=1 Tax=Zophobas morio TaxID=2755281 RepID=A0AA38I0N9_9CUCU|nr:hypothetical protein Zmor_022133 [Zophobas morio]